MFLMLHVLFGTSTKFLHTAAGIQTYHKEYDINMIYDSQDNTRGLYYLISFLSRFVEKPIYITSPIL